MPQGQDSLGAGDTITTDTGFAGGRGTYMGEEKCASVTGSVERENKLTCVNALQTGCDGEAGIILRGES